MHFRTLESRIVTLFLALILVGQAVSFCVIRNGIIDNEQAAIRDQLALGVPLFNRLLEQKAQTLTSSARAVSKDYGFRQAIASNDKETIESVLTNAGQRINASLTLFMGLDRQIKATTTKQQPGSLEQSILLLIDQAEEKDGAVGMSIFENRPYQVLVVPVRAPVTIGWIAMAFPLDLKLASDMRDLSSLDVSFMVSDKDGGWQADVSTLSQADASSVASLLQGLSGKVAALMPLRIAKSDYSVRILPLVQSVAGGQGAIVVLQRSIDEAIAPYRQLQVSLIMITGLVTFVAFILSFFAARRIASPLRDLTAIAKRLGDGDYQTQIEIKGDDEIRKLSMAFESMRGGIAKHESQIRRLAYWDTLTNLPNRAQFTVMLDEAIKNSAQLVNEPANQQTNHEENKRTNRRTNRHIHKQTNQQTKTGHILMMDLDRFKNVNDVLGHHFGDELLRQVAHRLTKTVGIHYPVARLGGDEFAVLLPMTDVSEAKEIAARVLKSLELPISLEDQTVDLGAGLGIAGFPLHGTDAESLMSRAEVAMYAAKINSNEAVLYDPALDKASQQNLSLLSELRRALECNEFKMFVQPKLRIDTGEFIGLEALVRWEHPEKGMIYPDQFIPFSEQTGFIRALTRWMLEQSAMLCRDLTAYGINAKISVNLSTRDLLDQNLPAKFSAMLARYAVSASSFCLEITESSIMDDPVRALLTLDGLHAMGVDLSIDDFGTGYSSLAYLKRLPVDELKIDQSFVMNMESDIEDAKIVRSTIDLGHNMGLRVVAEGIESEAVWWLLAKMGCDQGQGYFMSRPMPAAQLIGWIAQWVPPRMKRDTVSSK
ncbi:putative bifunctional diguanylate cyclase/phosphodiesterase [Solimicrobium silvestre]|uniref:GGDEF: diguanylate cyclase (GGDEF) domain n=1 Tax=Solimicrobium silvestre TaxID=2099400 RepID=A0A2S9H5I4_9BURK|nr:EAL domain-containing protein [Solimicrobium silvestre]PRC95242.1 GGDEF: diguanylate cyclase (GGDEF) domain [Solimicrobium silvestre]